MSNLRLLIVDGGYTINISLDLPDSLRYLEWWGCPLESFPSNFGLENLVELHMQDSKFKELWKEERILVNLQVINLSWSEYLTEVPNLSRSLKIVEIDLRYCQSLVEIPSYFQHLDKLTRLDLECCRSLKYLPEMLGSIQYLDLQSTGIKELPESVWSDENISYLNISHCRDLEKLPSNSCKLKASGCFNLEGCTSLGKFSELPRDITKLLLVDCLRLVSIPKSICKLKCLEELDISGCGIRNFPKILEPMENLRSLIISRTSVEQLYTSSIEFFPALENIEREGCNMLSCISKSMLKYVKRPDEYETSESDDHGSEASEIEDDSDL